MAKNQDTLLFKYYLSVALVNAVVIYVTPMLFPDTLVLGTSTIPPLVAAIIAGVLLTLIISLVDPLMKHTQWKVTDERAWAIIYGAVNILAIWGIARLAVYTGMGITSFMVAIVLGIILLLLQWGVWKMMLGKK